MVEVIVVWITATGGCMRLLLAGKDTWDFIGAPTSKQKAEQGRCMENRWTVVYKAVSG